VRYTNGTFIQLDVPGAMQTGAAGINNAGQIVGVSVSSDFLQHGFVATPVFRGTPGQTNCYGKSVSGLARQYGGLNSAATALDFPSVQALQNAILTFCGE
jgi:probable HAF family extracellular repeat protein